MLGKTEGKGEGVVKDEMVRQHRQFSGHEFEQTLVDSEGQGSLACYSPWGRKKLDRTQRLNNSKVRRDVLVPVSS